MVKINHLLRLFYHIIYPYTISNGVIHRIDLYLFQNGCTFALKFSEKEMF